MSSSLLRSASPNVRVEDEVWDMIFPDAKTEKHQNKAENTVQSTDPITARDIDVRDWSFTDRKKLESDNNRIKVFIDAELITTISKPLFRATSTKTSEILVDDAVILLAPVDADAVSRLVDYLEDIILNPSEPIPLPLSLPMITILNIYAAASALGMEKYVDSLYKECEDLLRTCIPSWTTIDAITSYATTTPHFSRLFRIMVRDLATRVWNETASNVEVFQMQLNPVLENSVKRANERYKSLLCRRRKYEFRIRTGYEYRHVNWGWLVRTKEDKEDEVGLDGDDYDGPVRRR